MNTDIREKQADNRQNLFHVVIVGGGFGGLYAARALAKAPVRVTIIDQHNYHLFRPMLYQVATGQLPAEEIAAPIRAILRKQQNVDVLMAEVTSIDTENKAVLMGDGRLAYDALIVATGVKYNYFGHDDWQPYAPSLTFVEDAAHIRGRILQAFETAEQLAAEGADAPTVQEWLTFGIVGAGPTGVELAGAIAELARKTLVGEYRHIDPRSARIILYEAGPRILPTFPEALGEKSRKRLQQIGVEVQTGVMVQNITAEGILAAGEFIRSRTALWAAGVIASPAGKWLGAEMDRIGRVKVNPDLTVPNHPEIFVIGDAASLIAKTRNLFKRLNPEPQPIPGLAQPAMQEGVYVAGVICRRLQNRPPLTPFVYWDKGNMAIVGRSFAIADFKFTGISGFFAWALWLGIHIFYLIGFANRILVILQWGISFFSNRRRVRIFTTDQQPRLPEDEVNALNGEPLRPTQSASTRE